MIPLAISRLIKTIFQQRALAHCKARTKDVSVNLGIATYYAPVQGTCDLDSATFTVQGSFGSVQCTFIGKATDADSLSGTAHCVNLLVAGNFVDTQWTMELLRR